MLWTKVKSWLVVAAGGLVGGLALLLYFIGLGKKIQKSESAAEGQEQEDEFRDSINRGHAAGDDARGRVHPLDPNDRANR